MAHFLLVFPRVRPGAERGTANAVIPLWWREGFVVGKDRVERSMGTVRDEALLPVECGTRPRFFPPGSLSAPAS